MEKYRTLGTSFLGQERLSYELRRAAFVLHERVLDKGEPLGILFEEYEHPRGMRASRQYREFRQLEEVLMGRSLDLRSGRTAEKQQTADGSTG